MRTFWRGIAAGVLVFTPSVLAHPHSFIAMQTEVLAEDGQFIALKMRWTMDEITSADLLYDAGNAPAGSPVWKKLAAEVMANVLGQHYFSEVWRGDNRVKFRDRPSDYGLAREKHQAVLSFVLPLATPQPLAGQRYCFATFDPTYYVDMHYARDADVRLSAQAAKTCALSVVTPTPGDEVLSFAQSLDKADAPEDMNLGRQFAQQVTLQCQ